MKKRFRSRRILPVSFSEPTEPDVAWENGMITLRGETLRKARKLAKAMGMSVPDYINGRLKQLMRDPELLAQIIAAAQVQKARFAL